jgi:hypothetical protein
MFKVNLCSSSKPRAGKRSIFTLFAFSQFEAETNLEINNGGTVNKCFLNNKYAKCNSSIAYSNQLIYKLYKVTPCTIHNHLKDVVPFSSLCPIFKFTLSG